MAEAPDPQGISGDDDGGNASDADPVEPELKYSEAEHKAALKREQARNSAAFAKLRKEKSDLEARLSALEEEASKKSDSGKSELQLLKDRLEKAEREARDKVAAAEQAAAEERNARHQTTIRHAIQAEIAKRGWKEPELIEAYLLRGLVVDEGGEVVRKDSENLQTDLKSVFDEFGKAHPGIIPPAPAGAGSRPGAPTRTGKKLPGELTGSDLERAVEDSLRGAMGRKGVVE